MIYPKTFLYHNVAIIVENWLSQPLDDSPKGTEVGKEEHHMYLSLRSQSVKVQCIAS